MSFTSQEHTIRILERLLRFLNATSVEKMHMGGSPAHVLRVETGEEKLVLKIAFYNQGVVDGHDLETFRLKARQMRAIQAQMPGLRPYYAQLLYEFSGIDWAAYCTPFYSGTTPTTLLRTEEQSTLERFYNTLNMIITTLIVHGYERSSIVTPQAYFERLHLDRVRRRLWLLKDHLPSVLFGTEKIIINGRACLTVPALLDQLQGHQELLAMLQPSRLFFPVHGDANLGNFIVTVPQERNAIQAAFKVLDPRGTTDHWDILYDIAKMLFSLSLFDAAMEQGFSVLCTTVRSTPAYTVLLHHSWPGYKQAALGFLGFLETVDSFQSLVQPIDPSWRLRLLFIHTMHVLAEAACRLSDRKKRQMRDKHGIAVRQELALGLFLYGTLLLNDLYEQDNLNKPINVYEHLGLIQTIPAAPLL